MRNAACLWTKRIVKAAVERMASGQTKAEKVEKILLEVKSDPAKFGDENKHIHLKLTLGVEG